MENLKATSEQISNFISENPLWSLEENKLHREFIFKDFVMAFGFMEQVVLIAESVNHQPEWFNVYKKVVVNLTTHEANGISSKDFTLAQALDSIANQVMS